MAGSEYIGACQIRVRSVQIIHCAEMEEMVDAAG